MSSGLISAILYNVCGNREADYVKNRQVCIRGRDYLSVQSNVNIMDICAKEMRQS